MREQLRELENQRLRFRAEVNRFGFKKNYHGYPQPTILFSRIERVDTGEELTDHVWFDVRKTIENLNLRPGSIVEFDARVTEYEKGYVNIWQGIDNSEIDYRLSHPTKFEVLARTHI